MTGRALRSATCIAMARRPTPNSIEALVETPQAVWFTKGTPAEVQRSVGATVRRAKGTVPVLVAYNIPFRDCAQFSAGGATNTADYLAWIDAFAAGIGDSEAIVILEPDGLGIIPHYVTIDGAVEWCQPSEAEADTAAADRFFQLNQALDRLNEQPNVSVYLDGTHSGWLNVGDIADRLVKAGVARAAGFYLNASNYQFSPNLVQYGTWISKCIAGGTSAVVAQTSTGTAALSPRRSRFSSASGRAWP